MLISINILISNWNLPQKLHWRVWINKFSIFVGETEAGCDSDITLAVVAKGPVVNLEFTQF